MNKEFTFGDYQRLEEVLKRTNPDGVERSVLANEAYALGFERGKEGVTEYPIQVIIDLLKEAQETEKYVRFSVTSEGYAELSFRDGENPAEMALTLEPGAMPNGETWLDPEDPLTEIIKGAE